MFKHNDRKLEDREQQYFSSSMNSKLFDESFVDEIRYKHNEDAIVSVRRKSQHEDKKCGKYLSKGSLVRHKTAVHDGIRYPCEEC